MATQTAFYEPYVALNRAVRAWNRHDRLRLTLLWLPRSLLPGLVLGVALALVSRLRPWLLPREIALVTAVALVLGLLVMIAVIWAWPRPTLAAARRFDRLFNLNERVSTALELIDGRIRASDELAHLQIQDAWQRVGAVRARDSLPLRLNGHDWLGVALVALLLAVLLLAPNPVADAAEADDVERAAIEEATDELRDIHEDIAADPDLSDEERESLLETLETSIDRLEQPDITAEEAFATLADTRSALEERAESLEQSAAAAAAIQNAAGALQNMEMPMQRLESGEDAAQQLQQSLNQMAQELETMTQQQQQQQQQQMAQSLQAAGQAMAGVSPQAAQQMQQAAQAIQNGQQQAAQNALQQAQQAVQQVAQQQQAAQNASQQMSQAAQQAQQAASQVAQAGQQGQQGQAAGQQMQGNQQSGDSQQGNQAGVGGGAGDQPGGAGSDQQQAAAGQQQPPGTGNNPDGEGESQFAPVFSPRRIGGEPGEDVVVLEPDGSTSPVVQGDFAQNPDGQSLVPYNQVFSSYAGDANRALESDYIPLAMRDLIRNYFTSLEPGQSPARGQ